MPPGPHAPCFADHGGGHERAMLTLLLIVLIVLLLFGGVGYGYRGRRRL